MLAEAREGGRVDAIEGRIRALQRVAYGADTTDAERARAVAEIAELIDLAAGGTGRDELPSPGRTDERDGGTKSADEAEAALDRSSFEGAREDDSPGRARLMRWTIVAGGIGLLLGAAVGWGADRLVPPDAASISTIGPSSSGEPGTPLEDTDLLPLFDRLPLAAEATRVAGVDDSIDPASVRLLANRTDGPAAYLARTVDGDDVCLVLLLPAGPSRSACTADGRLPAEGLGIQYNAQGYGLAVARLAPTGTVALGLIVTF
jgi:hypothetical protein